MRRIAAREPVHIRVLKRRLSQVNIKHFIFPKSQHNGGKVGIRIHTLGILHDTSSCHFWHQPQTKSKLFTEHPCHAGLTPPWSSMGFYHQINFMANLKDSLTLGRLSGNDEDNSEENSTSTKLCPELLLCKTLSQYLRPLYSRVEVVRKEFEQSQTFFFCHCKSKEKKKGAVTGLLYRTH